MHFHKNTGFSIPSSSLAFPIIEVQNLKTILGGNVIHENLNLNIYPGELLSLIGGSGSGKTTLLRQITGLETPTEGQVKVLGYSLSSLSAQDWQSLTQRWGVLFQAGALFSALSVFENIALPLREYRKIPHDLIHDVVVSRLAMVGLNLKDSEKRPADLSGGMIKRAALARALVLDPELLFLDEPTAGLDPERADEFVALLRQLHTQLGFTMVMVTHDLDTLLALSSRIAVLADRHVIACGTITEILELKHPFIQTFLLGERGRRALVQQPIL